VWRSVAYAISALQPWALMALPALRAYTGPVAGATLIMAGVYQFSPLKQVCLAQCRAPLGYVLTHWHAGNRGAIHMGLHHGLFCIGCCWALMAILFVVGIMNMAWMAVLALFMLVEKASASATW
jgi:predicted metal-binding membrane protein